VPQEVLSHRLWETTWQIAICVAKIRREMLSQAIHLRQLSPKWKCSHSFRERPRVANLRESGDDGSLRNVHLERYP